MKMKSLLSFFEPFDVFYFLDFNWYTVPYFDTGVCDGFFLSRLVFVCGACKFLCNDYRKTSNIRRTLVGNKIVDHSDVVGASPVGAAPTTSSFST